MASDVGSGSQHSRVRVHSVVYLSDIVETAFDEVVRLSLMLAHDLQLH